jgi:TonB family protein
MKPVRWGRAVTIGAWAVGILAAVVLLVLKIYHILQEPVEAPKQVVQEIKIIRPPPPPPDTEPPPPPPPDEKVDLPEPTPDPVESSDPPPGEQLGVDAEGSGGGDGFGLVGRPGGRDLLASGGSALSWYAGIVKSEILARLDDEQKIRSGSYSVVVRLWIKPDGTIERANLASSSGDKERDRAIESALSQITRLSRAPPPDTPQPISLRIMTQTKSPRIQKAIHAAVAMSLLCGGGTASAAQSERQSLEELRNTVVNLLQGLVQRGVITREQAEQMVREAQAKAESDAAAVAAQEEAEKSAVRIPYVPQVVKDEIKREVAADLGAQVTKNVVEAAQNDGWGAPAALPDWVRRMRWTGDVRMRTQGDLYADGNIPNAYLDFQRINEAGGRGRAGVDAFANTTEDRERLRARLRFGFEAVLGYGWSVGARIASGSLRDPISTNQTLGNSSFRYQPGIDLAYVDWTHNSSTGRNTLGLTGGRIRNPFYNGTDLVFDQDLTFEGVAGSFKLGLANNDPASRYAYAVAGAFPLQEVELSSHDKWLFGGQLGLDWKFDGGSRFRVGAGYYRFLNVSGRRNSFDSKVLDFTAPQYLRQGNTLFDIRNDTDATTNLYALAADYGLANLSAAFDWRLGVGHKLSLVADYVENVGYDEAKMLARTGFIVDKRNVGYQAELSFGSSVMTQAHAWRAVLGYRYLERDAVLDSLTDSDFRLGGTDVKGFTVGFDYSLTPMVMGRLKYLSGNEIDGAPLGIDVVQLDITASF